MSGPRNKVLTKIYAVIGIAIVIAGTAVTLKLVYNLWFPPFFREKPLADDPRREMMRSLARGIQPDSFTVAYRGPEVASPIDRFHGIPVPVQADSAGLCLTCHGLLPHAKEIETRSFRNMHSANIACETCHMGGDGKPYFRWYDVKTGLLLKKINITGPLKRPGYKIMALYGPEIDRYDKSALIREAKGLLEAAPLLSEEERGNRIKPFHKNLKKLEDTVKCAGCHGAGGEIFLPFESLGYPPRRIDALLHSEIIGMLTKYKEFYLPAFLSDKPDAVGGEKP